MTQKQKLTAVAIGAAVLLIGGPLVLNAVQRNDADQATEAATLAEGSSSTGAASNGSNSTASKVTVKTEAAPAEPVVTTLSGSKIPAGTLVKTKITTPISTRNAKVGDRVSAVTLENVVVNGDVVIPAGATVTGRVTEVKPAAETKSAAVLKVAFSQIGNYSTSLSLVTPDLVARAKNANRAVDAGLVLGGAATGAVIGNQTDNRRGSEIGAVVGGVVGGVAAANIGANVQLLEGETATLRFNDSLAI